MEMLSGEAVALMTKNVGDLWERGVKAKIPIAQQMEQNHMCGRKMGKRARASWILGCLVD